MESTSEEEELNELRILCIDGGGSRGVVPIAMLKELEKQIAPKKVLECFDLICGTSTGGIIALGLCAGYEIGEIERAYDELVSEVFSPGFSNYFRYVSSLGGSYYDISGLEKALKNFFPESHFLDASSNNKPKCFVVATELSSTHPLPYLLRNYTTPRLYDSQTTLGNYFITADTSECDKMPLWAAARATSAAPTYFPPFSYKKETGNYIFADGGLVANCPIEFALQDAFAMYPNASLAYVLSLGTGCAAMTAQPTQRSILKWGQLSVNLLTDSERIYQNSLRWLGSSACRIKTTGEPYTRTRVIRWNPILGVFASNLDETRKPILDQMKKEAIDYMNLQGCQSDIAWFRRRIGLRNH